MFATANVAQGVPHVGLQPDAGAVGGDGDVAGDEGGGGEIVAGGHENSLEAGVKQKHTSSGCT